MTPFQFLCLKSQPRFFSLNDSKFLVFFNLKKWSYQPDVYSQFWKTYFGSEIPKLPFDFLFLMSLQALSKKWVGINQCVWYKAKKTVQISWEFITWTLTKVKLLTSQSLELSSHINSFSYIWNTEHIFKLLKSLLWTQVLLSYFIHVI